MNGIFKFNLGDQVKDRITGFEGIVVARVEWINQCDRYDIQPITLTKDGEVRKREGFDEQDLILVKAKRFAPALAQVAAQPAKEPTRARTGGPRDISTRRI